MSEVLRTRPMTSDERGRWRIADDQCPTLITTLLPLDSACLLPMPSLSDIWVIYKRTLDPQEPGDDH